MYKYPVSKLHPASENFMATDENLSRDFIKRILLEQTESCIDVSVDLLQTLSDSLGTIIGTDGFESLLLRAARRVENTYPWFQCELRTTKDDPDFEKFRQYFQAQSLADSQTACILLFTIFFDILESLVGAHLTIIILEKAFSRTHANKKSKEQNNG